MDPSLVTKRLLWRLQLGAQMLVSTSCSVAQIASEVGYESELAFNRAFKREFELPPARFRSEAKSGYILWADLALCREAADRTQYSAGLRRELHGLVFESRRLRQTLQVANPSTFS